MSTMPFGKHRGKSLQTLPDDYLQWLVGNVELREPLRSAVYDELDRRRPPQSKRLRTCPHPGVAVELIGCGLRSLARRYHPDAGGSHDRMVEVTAAADWLRERIERAA
jgi:hypothetical protein